MIIYGSPISITGDSRVDIKLGQCSAELKGVANLKISKIGNSNVYIEFTSDAVSKDSVSFDFKESSFSLMPRGRYIGALKIGCCTMHIQFNIDCCRLKPKSITRSKTNVC